MATSHGLIGVFIFLGAFILIAAVLMIAQFVYSLGLIGDDEKMKGFILWGAIVIEFVFLFLSVATVGFYG